MKTDNQLIIDDSDDASGPSVISIRTADEPVQLGSENWVTGCASLKLHGMTQSLISQTVLVSAESKKVVLATNAHTMKLLNEMHRQRIADAFAEYFGEMPEIIIEIRNNLPETPERYSARLKTERLSEARDQFGRDPFIAILTQRFGGSIRADTIEPRDGETHV